jgi:alpha-ketoglutarate-dependent taurine dioxygenase
MDQQRLKPFGLEIRAESPQSDLDSVNVGELQQLVEIHRLCVLRGFKKPSETEILSICRRLGKIRQWKFGEIVELKVHQDTNNYLYTSGEVPFHWDGAFTSSAPHYIFLACAEAIESGSGGETVFCDAGELIANASAERKEQWKQITITYTPDGPDSFTSALIQEHPITGIPVLRYAEPIQGLNPMKLTIHGIAQQEQDTFISEMHSLLHNPDLWYVQSWKTGDILIADNYALLHARRGFDPDQSRRLIKVNIL